MSAPDSIIECTVLKHNGDSYDLEPTDPNLQALKHMSPIYGLIAGKIRRRVRLVPGDRVKAELSGYKSKAGQAIGRIIERIKTHEEIMSPTPVRKRKR